MGQIGHGVERVIGARTGRDVKEDVTHTLGTLIKINFIADDPEGSATSPISPVGIGPYVSIHTNSGPS